MLFRSAFWLVAAYLVIQPQGVDLDGAAEAMTAQAMAAGQRVVVDHMLGRECGLDCLGAAALAAATAPQPEPVAAATVEAVEPPALAPVPRPRLDRAA